MKDEDKRRFNGGRPKVGTTKQSLTLSVKSGTREQLTRLSQHYEKSISCLLEEFAEKEIIKLERKEKALEKAKATTRKKRAVKPKAVE